MQLLNLRAFGILAKVPNGAVHLLTEKGAARTTWRDIHGHQFCQTCGMGMFRIGYPGEKASVNARCIEYVDVFALDVRRYDGPNPQNRQGCTAHFLELLVRFQCHHAIGNLRTDLVQVVFHDAEPSRRSPGREPTPSVW